MIFEKHYYVKSETSNYEDYREKKFHELASDLYPFVADGEVLDFGAATGGLVHELRSRGVDCVGTDISYWAVNFGRQHYGLSSQELQYHNIQLLEEAKDTVLFLDVLEHIGSKELEEVVKLLSAKQLIVRIPISKNEGEDFVLDVSKNDKTHIQIHGRDFWLDLFKKNGYHTFMPFCSKSIYDSEGVLAGILKN